MRRSDNKRSLAALFTLLSTCVVHAAPTTQRAIDPNTVEVVSKTAGVRFRVPKNWTPIAIATGDPTLLFVFDTATPANGKPVRASSVGLPRQFHVYLNQPLKHGATLEDAVTAAKKQLSDAIKDLAFSRDEATTFAGEPAWAMAWKEKVNQHVVTTSNGKSTPSDRQVDIIREKVLWIKDQKLCDAGTLSDPASVPMMEKLIENVRKSFEYDAAK